MLFGQVFLLDTQRSDGVQVLDSEREEDRSYIFLIYPPNYAQSCDASLISRSAHCPVPPIHPALATTRSHLSMSFRVLVWQYRMLVNLIACSVSFSWFYLRIYALSISIAVTLCIMCSCSLVSVYVRVRSHVDCSRLSLLHVQEAKTPDHFRLSKVLRLDLKIPRYSRSVVHVHGVPSVVHASLTSLF